MDKEKVVKMDNIITKFQIVYTNIKQERNSGFYLFMVLKMDEFTDKWSVVISAPWYNSENQHETFQYITNNIRKVLTPAEISTIARVGTFLPTEHLVTLVNQTVRVTGGSPVRLEDTKINGYQIHEAYIFESIPPNDLKQYDA
ncbi:MAG: hypothetical protein AAB553_08225 [Patescibacteria group bacterium]